MSGAPRLFSPPDAARLKHTELPTKLVAVDLRAGEHTVSAVPRNLV
jgi:hypothetical protein